jgi:hypothetical protein
LLRLFNAMSKTDFRASFHGQYSGDARQNSAHIDRTIISRASRWTMPEAGRRTGAKVVATSTVALACHSHGDKVHRRFAERLGGLMCFQLLDEYVLDVFRDMSLEPKKVKGGTVTEGVSAGMDALWAWVLSTVPHANQISVAGHSLGASRTHLTPLYLPAGRIGALHSFEAPKFADAQYYAAYAAKLAGMVCFLNGRDTWAAWPWIDLRWQARPPQDHVWLQGTGFTVIPAAEWPGAASFSDHGIDMVQERCEKIAAEQLRHVA